MIAKADDDLEMAVMEVEKNQESSELYELMPDWMRESLLEGTVLFMESTDYATLDQKIKDHLRIIKY
jgi:hypothetical protein